MKKVKASFRAMVYAKLRKSLGAITAEEAKQLEGKKLTLCVQWAEEIDKELKSKVKREAMRLQKVTEEEGR